MAMSVRPQGMQGIPRHSPTDGIGRAITLLVRRCMFTGTLLGIWGGTAGHVRPEDSTSDTEADMQQGLRSGRIPWWAPVLMLAARPVFALATQLAVAADFVQLALKASRLVLDCDAFPFIGNANDHGRIFMR